MNELTELAKLDGLVGASAKKQETSVSNAVSKTEKIRDWVSLGRPLCKGYASIDFDVSLINYNIYY